MLHMLSYVACFPELLVGCAAIVDMGMMWRLTAPSAEDRYKGEETEFTWADYAEKMFNTIVKWHQAADMIFLVNDP